MTTAYTIMKNMVLSSFWDGISSLGATILLKIAPKSSKGYQNPTKGDIKILLSM
jgi:hypothetical protein